MGIRPGLAVRGHGQADGRQIFQVDQVGRVPGFFIVDVDFIFSLESHQARHFAWPVESKKVRKL